MTGSAVLTLIATILTAEPGIVEIDLGSRGGLRPGDEGVVFYEVVLDDQVQTIEIGPASVIETASFTSKLKVAADLPARPGFLVRFDRSSDRPARAIVSAQTPLAPETSSRSVQLSGDEPASGASIAYVANLGGSCLKVRSLPTTASPEAGCLQEGTAVAVIREVPEWTRALLGDGKKGWLASRYLSAAPPRSAARAPARPPAPRKPAQPDASSAAVSRPPTMTPTMTPKVAPEPVDAGRLLDKLERAEALVGSQISQLAASQDAVLEAHEARNELLRRLLQATADEYESELAATANRLEEAERGRAELATDTDRLQTELDAANAELLRVDAERERLIEQLEATNSELAQIEAIATAAKDALRQEIRATETALAALRNRLEARESQLAETEARLETVQAEHTALVASSGAGGGNEGSMRDVGELEAALMDARNDKQALEVWLEERGEELARAEAKVAIMQAEIDRLEAMAPRNRQEIENTRAALADASRRAADLELRLQASEERKRDLERELAASQDGTGKVRAPDPGRRAASRPITDLAATQGDAAGLAAPVVVLESAKPCLNFRAEPKIDSEAFDCLPPGTRLGSLGHWEGWHYVELVDGRAGWVASRHLGPVGSAGSGP